MASIFERMAGGLGKMAHAYNVFRDEDENRQGGYAQTYGSSSGSSPNRRRMSGGNDRSIIASVYMRLGIDVSSVDIRHVRLDENMRYEADLPSGLNTCLTLEANIDQGARAFKQDLAMTMFEKGNIAIVPTDTSTNPKMFGSYDINSMRVGEIVQWMPRSVRVRLWNDVKGRHEEVTVPKNVTAIVENPFYQVMNEPNSTLQRLVRKLNILDAVDEASASGKLDLLIQLPYTIKSQARREQANERAKDIEMQLKGSQYGIAYVDATEKITQLNRPVENNLLAQIEFLTKMLYGQLGLTEDVFTGAADEQTMLNYYARTIEPVLAAITDAMKRTFLTKTARTQRQSIMYFRDPFKLLPLAGFAEIADKLGRNEVLSSNELRGIIGFRPSSDPKAEKLVNSNMPQPPEYDPAEQDAIMENTFKGLEAAIAKISAGAPSEEDVA
jgi:hypothetical protein